MEIIFLKYLKKDPGAVISEVFANIVTSDGTKGSPLTIEVEFMESDGFVINHVNYDINCITK